MWFYERRKAPASEHSFEVNELTGTKHSWNVNVVPFMLLFDEYKMNQGRKHVF